MEPVFFHVDMDAFFASVESLDNPAYRGKPLIVGGMGPRGVVSSCSYEARAFGVHSAMPMFKARQLCPHAVFVAGRMERYSAMSHKIVAILERFSPIVQQISIDEAFLDMSGTQRLFGPPLEAAASLKRTVKEETSLTISVGIAQTRYIAKMASAYGKPDGLCRVAPGKEILFVDTIGLKKLWGVGDASWKILEHHGITTPAQLRAWDLERLKRTFGNAAGEFYHRIACGEDPGIYAQEAKTRSISTETTFATDITDDSLLRQQLLRMSHEVMFRAIEEHALGSTVAIKLRYSDFSTISAQETPSKPIYSAEEIYAIACRLLQQKWKRSPVRLLGVGLHNIVIGCDPIQQELFDDTYRRKRELEKVILQLRNKGRKVDKATSLIDPDAPSR